MAEMKDRARKFFRRSSAQASPPLPLQSRPEASTSLPREPSSHRQRPRWSRTSSRTEVPSQDSASKTPWIAAVADEPSSTGPRSQCSTLQEAVAEAPILTVQQPSPDNLDTDAFAAKNTPSLLQISLDPPLTPESRPTSPQSCANRKYASVPTSPGLAEVDTAPTTVHVEDQTEDAPVKDYFSSAPAAQPALQRTMVRRKIWIKRAGASPTMVSTTEEDLVDDVRDMVLRKYANSLGRKWDAPDVSIRIVPRERTHLERVLNPDEPICNIVDAYFPGGQTLDEALLINVPRRPSPQQSPRLIHPHHGATFEENSRPLENGTDYFPPMPSSPHPSHSGNESRHSVQHPPMQHSISVLETGQVPPLPSPGPRDRSVHHRPRPARQHTSSPTILTTSANPSATASQHHNIRQNWRRMNTAAAFSGQRNAVPPAPPLPASSPGLEVPQEVPSNATSPSMEGVTSPRGPRRKKHGKQSISGRDGHRLDPEERRASHAPTAGLSTIEASVPPINVLIVEDNPITLKVLEMFTRRLKVRWSSVMNGQDAVTKWRSGGFHLVLMDIQLPIMNGLEATKEIRRLERVNGIGVFAKVGNGASDADSKRSDTPTKAANGDQIDRDDKLGSEGDSKLGTERLFKSPVIIVALTASSLQSDRHEALAAGCNDFLTKPVHFPWLERKVMEWGCMQALIDFDGWRKWKDLAAAAEAQQQKDDELDPAAKEKREKKEAKRAAMLAKMNQR